VRRLLVIALCFAFALPGFAKQKKQPQEYALIFGTVFGPDEHPVPGVPVVIQRADKKKPKYEHVSDARGEFAQRVPVGPADYVVRPQLKDKQAAEKAAVKVRIEKDERHDIALHLTNQEQTKK
jgi:hypothetical protein